MGIFSRFLIAAIACLTISSGTFAQEYSWTVTYPPIDSSSSSYSFIAVDCWNEVCTAIGTKRTGQFADTVIACRSTDGGQTWVEQTAGLPASGNLISSYVVFQQIDSLHAVITANAGFCFMTSNGGVSWYQVNLHTNADIWDVNFFDSTTGIIVKKRSTAPDTGNILITHNGGRTWRPASFSPWNFAFTCHSYGDSSFSVISADWGPLYTTIDDWNTVDSTGLIVPHTDSNYLVAFANFKGRDTIVCYGADHTNNNSLSSPPYMYIKLSTDDGGSWNSPAIADSSLEAALSMSSLERDIVFLGGYRGGIKQYAVSQDHGLTWSIEPYISNTDSLSTWLRSVAVTPSNEGVGVFAPLVDFFLGLTSAPTYLARGVPMSSSVAFPLAKQALVLYPNPVAGTLTIASLPSGTSVSVLDLLGREVARGTVPQSGSLALDVSGLAAGIYCVSDGVSNIKFVKQ